MLLTASNTYSGGTILGPDALASVYALPGPITFSANATLQAAGPTFAVTSNVVLDSNVTATIDTAGYSVPVSGTISGAGNLNKAGGTLILANSNTYSGGTSISQGTLQLASAAAVQNSTVSINADNGLQFSPGIGTFDVGGLSGSNSLTLSDTSGGPVDLAVGGNNANTTFSGSIGGNGGLVKSGSGVADFDREQLFHGRTGARPGRGLDHERRRLGLDVATGRGLAPTSPSPPTAPCRQAVRSPCRQAATSRSPRRHGHFRHAWQHAHDRRRDQRLRRRLPSWEAARSS